MKKKTVWIIGVVVSLLIPAGIAAGIILTRSLRDQVKPETKENDLTTETVPETIPVSTEEKTPLTAADSDEIRGVFIASIFNLNFPSKPGLSEIELKKEIDEIIETSVSAGCNTIYFQVRPSGDALYASSVFPTSRYLVKTEGDAISFDPLAYFVTVCRERNVSPVAWVNPYRVTNFVSSSKEAALASLSEKNPARLHPAWCLFYGGKLFYDPGRPEALELILSGVREICENYDVDGILYDDYFYPYPVSGETIHDSASFALYGDGMELDEWRRDNVDRLIEETSSTVKSVSDRLTFTVSPFGIWRNQSSDPRGSETKGLESDTVLYSDSLKWIENGWVDVIAPQIYWERGYEVADFSKLVRWWSAQVDGTKVGFAPALAVYRIGEWTEGSDEIIQQIQFARSYMNNVGCILYGYADLAANTDSVREKLSAYYASAYSIEDKADSPVKGVSFRFPRNGYSTPYSGVFVLVSSDPAHPVRINGQKIGRTKSGFFSVYQNLNYGANTLVVVQNQESYSLRMTRTSGGGGSSSDIGSFAFQSVVPDGKTSFAARSGKSIAVSVVAPSGSSVTATLAGKSFVLSPQGNPSGSASYIPQTYTGVVTLPDLPDGEEMQSVGRIVFHCTRWDGSVSRQGGEFFVIPENLHLIATVKKDYSFLKTGTSTSFYDDYLNTNIGMTDEIVEQRGDFYRLAFGGFIHKDNVSVSASSSALPAVTIGEIRSQIRDEKTFEVLVPVSRGVPMDVKMEEKTLIFTLFCVEAKGTPVLVKNPLFSGIRQTAENGVTRISFDLFSLENFYGWDYSYTEDGILFSFTMPRRLPETDLPLQGMTVIVDAGHGGSDSGAIGYLPGGDEKDLNLSVALKLRDRLQKMGAEVVMSRTDDSTVDLYQRMDLYNDVHPDFAISVHHNSVAETTDANKGRGVWGLYWAYAGRGLAIPLQQSVKNALGTWDFGSKAQELAVCRNYKFPQALIEMGFICSPAEYERSTHADYADVCAEALANGVLDYFANQAAFLEKGGF